MTRHFDLECPYCEAGNEVRHEGKDLDSAVILAVTAKLVGRLIAMQYQRKYSTEQVMKMVAENIE